MRKKLLRSRSGFEKPESREEAIMQNILGASNVLEPSESNIEEILKSILYNTPYTKEAEFEIEKILLAIKDNGTYDGEVESRDMKILLAILRDSNYTEEPESRIEELFIEWLQQRQQIKVLEGVPPLTFTARGLPLINYLIEGKTIQNGTPTPDSPIMPQGTGERTGNLFDATTSINGIINDNGNVISNFAYSTSDYIRIDAEFTISLLSMYTPSAQIIRCGYYTGSKQHIANADSVSFRDGYKALQFSPPNGTTFIRFSFISREGYADTHIMLNTGSTPLPYEPYGYKIPISSNSTTTPVYLGEVETTRRIKKLVLTGEEEWKIWNGNYFSSVIDRKGAIDTLVCSHFINSSPNGISYQHKSTSGLKIASVVVAPFVTSVSELKTWIAAQYTAGTPVTVWYVLATEETGIVNEPLMRIGDYADTVSMEQAGVQIPTNNGTTVIDVDTTVKPSNIYIEYK